MKAIWINIERNVEMPSKVQWNNAAYKPFDKKLYTDVRAIQVSIWLGECLSLWNCTQWSIRGWEKQKKHF